MRTHSREKLGFLAFNLRARWHLLAVEIALHEPRRRAHSSPSSSSSSTIVIHYLISAALSVLINPDTGTQYYENVTARGARRCVGSFQKLSSKRFKLIPRV
jgi:hypothetical protein